MSSEITVIVANEQRSAPHGAIAREAVPGV